MGNNDNNNENKEEKPRVIVHWNSTQFKPTIYDLETFNQVKQKPRGSTADYTMKVFNPATNNYESPAKIDFLPPSRKKKRGQSLSQQQ
jgi:hypothetical protein